jgi:DNA-binding NarL/FixJ family response regulator
LQCAEAGVTCYVPREASVNELVEAMREAAKGECYCPPKIAACIIKKLQSLMLSAKNKYMTSSGPRPLRGSANKRQTCLTQREQQIARMLVVGLSNKQIARNLFIEVSTVKSHVHNVLVKLEVKSRSQAAFSLQDRSLFPGSKSMDLDPI